MKKKLKRLMIVGAGLGCVALAVVIGAVVWIESDAGIGWIQSRIDRAITGRIAIERLRLSLVETSVDLYGVVLRDAQGDALAGLDHLGIALDPWALRRPEIRLENVLLQGLWAELSVDRNKAINLVAALKPPSETHANPAKADDTGLPVNIVVASLRLTQGRFSFKPTDDAALVQATGIDLTANGNLMDRSGNLTLSVADLRLDGTDLRPPPAGIALKARLDGDRLDDVALHVNAGATTFTLSGSVDNLTTQPVLDGVISLKSQLAQVTSIFNLAGDYDGSLDAELTLKGGLENPDAGLILSVGAGHIAGQPLDRGDVVLDLHDRQITLSKAAWRLADGTVQLNGTLNLREVFPTGFLVPTTDVDAITYDLALIQEIPRLAPWLERFIDIQGRAGGRLSLSGKGITPEAISATLTLDTAGRELIAPSMDRPVEAGVDLSARMEHGRITLSRFEAFSDGLDLSGDGRFQFQDRKLAGNLRLTAEDLSRALAVVGLGTVSGTVDATLTADGSLNKPQFSLGLTAKNLNVDAYSLGNLTVDAAMDPEGRLQLTTLRLKNQASRIQGSGRIRLLPGGKIDPDFENTLTLNLEKLSADHFTAMAPVDGTLDGRLELGGKLASLTGKLSAKGTDLRTDAVTIGNLEALLRLESGKLRVDRLDLQNQGSTLRATGDIQLLEPGSLHPVSDPVVDISARSDHFDPGNFVEGAGGDFNFNGVLKGSIEQPIGRITLSGRQAELAGQPIDSIALDARFEDRRLWLERLLAIVAPGEQIEAGGWVGLDQTADLKLRIDALSLAHVAHLPQTIPAKGVLSLDATARGSVQNPDVEGQLTVSNVQVNQKPIQDIDLSFSLHDMLAEVTGRLNFAINAVYDLKKGDFDARLGFDETETAAYFAAAGQPDLHGTLSGRVQAAGNIQDPANSTAHMELSALHLIFKEISLVRSDRLVVDLAKGKLSIARFDLDLLRSGRLNMTGGGQIGGNLDLTIDGRIPLAAASAFNDQMVDSVGSVVLAGRVTGDSADPLIDLRVDLDGIGMAVPVLAQRLHDLNGRVHLNKEQLRVEGLKGFLDTGSFSIDGAVMLDNLKPTQIDLTVEAKSLPVEVPDTMSVLLNGDIRMTGKDRIARAGGEIVILEGVYYKDVKINLLQLATTRQRTVQPEKAPLSVPYFDRVDLDINVKNRQPFLVQNNLAQLEVSPDLKIGGNLAQPVISGRALVNSGTVTFQKKRFEVKKGIIDFVDPYKTEAVVDIQSETTIRDWTITLAIKGTPDNLDLTLSSVPSESDSDILSLILFGRTARELTAGEGGTKRSTGQIMAEMIADTFGEDVKKATGVDILQLETGGAGDGEDAADVKVTVGKHLSDRMTVKYAVETKDGETIQRAITEYKLLENILVSGFQDSQGTYGSELVFRIEFR